MTLNYREKLGMTTTVDKVDDLVRSVERLASREVLVGIPAGSARAPEPGEKGQPLDNATIGYIMENGSPAANIPARPFLVPGIRSAQDQIADKLGQAAKAALTGSDVLVDAKLTAAGLVAENAVKRKITDGPHTPLAPGTIAGRRRRKPPRMGTKPLIDTGQLRRSVTHVIREVDDDG